MPKIPLFKSHYSFGRSILSLEPPAECEADGPASIVNIAKANGLKEVFLLEDNISSLPLAFKAFKKEGIQLRYGENFEMRNSANEKVSAKISIFALSDAGCKDLVKLHTEIHTGDGAIKFERLQSLGPNLGLCIPFYDSFLMRNFLGFDVFVEDFAKLKPKFLLEDNGLPEDFLLRKKVIEFADNNECPTQEVQTVLYENDADCAAYMVYRMACERTGKKSDISNPNLDGFGSSEFSWERFKRENL